MSRGKPWMRPRPPANRHDDARVGVVEAVFAKPNEGGVLLHEQDKLGIALNVGDPVHQRRDGLRPTRHVHETNADRA